MILAQLKGRLRAVRLRGYILAISLYTKRATRPDLRVCNMVLLDASHHNP